MAPENIIGLERPGRGENQAVAHLNQASAEVGTAPVKRNGLREHGLEQIQTILRAALDSEHAISLERFKRAEPYPEPEPPPLRYREFPPEPQPHHARYRVAPDPEKTTAALEMERREAHERYLLDYSEWSDQVQAIEIENQRRYADHAAAVKRWKAGRERFLQDRAVQYEFVARKRAAYEALRPEGVEDYFRQVLSDAPLPGTFQRVFDLQYLRASKVLVVEHCLPLPDALPPVRGMKRVESQDALIEVPLSDDQLDRIYVRVLCEICLRTLHELFDADDAGALDTLVFNGWIALPGADGGGKRMYAASIQARREDFLKLKLGETDAGTSFETLHGKIGAGLHQISPVQPVLTISRPSVGRKPAPARSATWTE